MVFETEVSSLKTKVAELEAHRDRDIRPDSRIARREVADSYREEGQMGEQEEGS